jgi:LysM repeat protein
VPSRKHVVVPAVSAVAATAAAIPAALSATVAPAVPVQHSVRAVLDVEVVRQTPQPRPLVTRFISASVRKTYTIVSGDTLSGIAGRFCLTAAKWPALFNGNRNVVKDADLIYPGQTLRMTCDGSMALPVATTDTADVAPVTATPVRHDRFDGQHGACGDGDGDGMDAPCSAIFPQQAPDPAPQRATAVVTGASGVLGGGSGGGWPGGAFGACVVARESGGDSQVMNSSGHYGLYQFSASTWQAYGGSPADFGHASVAEQERVFMNALVQGGQDNWSPYDGC